MNTARWLQIGTAVLTLTVLLVACGSSDAEDALTVDAEISSEEQGLPAATALPSPTATEPIPEYQTYEIGTDIWGIAIADLTGDSYPDIAVTDKAEDAVKLLLNQGDGSFSQAPDLATGVGLYSLVAADLDADLLADLIVAQSPEDEPGKLSVFLNNGDGTFKTAVDYYAVDSAWPFVADLDGDGDLDLVADVSTEKMPNGEAGAGVWLNGGDGVLQEGEHYYVVPGIVGNVVAEDLNDDTFPDLVVRHHPGAQVSVLLGNGDGSFQEPLEYETAAALRDITCADLNGDNYPDLVAVNRYGTVNVLFNDGGGVFGNAVDYDVGGDIYGVIAADMDGDAALDLLVGPTGSGIVSLLTNNGEGAFELTKDYYFKGAWASYFDVADVDMDGHLELVGVSGGTVYVFPLEVVD